MTDPVAVATHFATRLPPLEAEPVIHGHIHETYVIHCRAEGSNERIVLQRLNGVVFHDLEALAANRVRITEHLRQRAATRGRQPIVADVIATRSGASMHIDEIGAAWRAAPFIEGTRPLGPDATTAELRAAAGAFAELTRDLDDLPPPELVETIPHFHDFPRRRARLAAAVAADGAGRAHASRDLVAQATRLADRLEHELTAARALDLPARIVHNDAKLDNVLVDSTTGAVACIVDLDTVMTGTVLSDFGELARTAATTRPEDEPDVTKIELDHERFAALADGYVTGSGAFLDAAERECLALAGPLMSLENAVRFLTDHLDGDVYFRIHRAGHNAQRARAQLRLTGLMLDELRELRAVCQGGYGANGAGMKLDTSVLGPDAVDAVLELCNRSLSRPLLRADLQGALFAPDQPTVLRGDPAVGIVAVVPGEPDGYIRLLVVDPAHRGNGHGHALLAAAEADLAASRVITVGADAPYYLFPGVETSEIAMLCLLEKHRYVREEANFNMEVDLSRVPPDPGGTELASARDRAEVGDWMAEHWLHWRAEVLRALDKGTLLLARDGGGITGFCAWNVNRDDLLGPIASRPDLVGKHVGRPLLLGALHRMRAAGATTIEVAWVGPIRPYAAVGGRVTRLFFVYRKRRM